MDSQAIFFLRHAADIDHIAPVIHHWSQINLRRAWVVLYGNYSILGDFRVNFLRSLPGLRMFHISELAPQLIGRELAGDERDWMSQPDAIATQFDWIDALFQATECAMRPTVIVFDWIYDQFQRRISAKAKSLGIKLVALPHGLSTFPATNRMHAIDEIDPLTSDRFCQPVDALTIFDYLVYPSEDFLEICRPELLQRIKVLGSARYDQQWVNRSKTLIPKLDVKVAPEVKKLSFFLRSNCYPVFWEEIARTIKMLLNFPNICLLVQHHPRENDFYKSLESVYTVFGAIDQARFKLVSAEEIPSASLVEWSDMVLDLGTGMGFDAVVHNKPLIEVEYAIAYTSTISRELPEVRVDCRDELCEKVSRLCSGTHQPYYRADERERFLKKYLGDYRGNVLPKYDELLLHCLE